LQLSGNPEFRLLQIFLGKAFDRAQVYEVYLHVPTDRLACTCKGWELRHYCKHTIYVTNQVEAHGGYIAAVMREDAQLTPELMNDAAAFRQWLYDNGRVLMLE
jgi:hypothetical protein